MRAFLRKEEGGNVVSGKIQTPVRPRILSRKPIKFSAGLYGHGFTNGRQSAAADRGETAPACEGH